MLLLVKYRCSMTKLEQMIAELKSASEGATARPWAFDSRERYDLESERYVSLTIFGANENELFDGAASDYVIQNRENDYPFVVKAVNAHDKLISALERSIEALKDKCFCAHLGDVTDICEPCTALSDIEKIMAGE